MTYEIGNLVTGDYPVIVHQVNCKGVMGAGIAKQIRDKHPIVYSDYKNALAEGATLGHIVVSHESGLNGQLIISMFAQDGYGRNKRYTDYEAFKKCLNVLARIMNDYSPKGHYNRIAFPYGIDCGLAGGDWNIIQGMLKDFSEKVKQEVVIVNLE